MLRLKSLIFGTAALACLFVPAVAQIGPGSPPGVSLSIANTWTAAQTFQGATTLSAALTYGGVTLTNAVDGTGAMVLSNGSQIANLIVTGTLSASILRGGTATNATLVLESTSGSGSGDSTALKTGSQVTAINIDTNQLIALPRISSDVTHTDASVCEDTTSHALYSGSGTLGICLGTSSARYKRNITPLMLGLTEVMRMKPVRFFYRPGRGYDARKPYYGVLAEDLAGVAPELVGKDKGGKPNTADMMGIVPILVRAIQAQQREIAVLRVQIARRPAKG